MNGYILLPITVLSEVFLKKCLTLEIMAIGFKFKSQKVYTRITII